MAVFCLQACEWRVAMNPVLLLYNILLFVVDAISLGFKVHFLCLWPTLEGWKYDLKGEFTNFWPDARFFAILFHLTTMEERAAITSLKFYAFTKYSRDF